MKKRIISLILCGLMLVNVPAVFAQGEDTTVSENTVQFQGEEFDRSELSQETLEWLDWYNGLSEEEQLSVSSVPAELWDGTTPTVTDAAADEDATRGEVAAMLLQAADDYNPGVEKTDIIKGYEDGQLHEEWNVTRAEALVMLKRAFGELPEPTGHNARVAIPAESFTDIPEWAQTELADVFDAGIVAGTAEGIFSPDENVTTGQMELFIERVYSLFGSNLKDDFYATVNKDTLNNLQIQPGRVISGSLYDLQDKSADAVDAIIQEIISGTYEKGTKEQKIADFYKNVADMDSRNEIGVAPLTPYLELIDTAETIDDLIEIQSKLVDELYIYQYMGFGLTIDMKDSTKYTLVFSPIAINFPKDTYQNGTEQQIESYLKYMKTLFVLGGETEADAEAMANACFEMEKELSASMMNTEDSGNVDKIYNVFTMQEIRDMFPNVDMDAVFADSGLQPADEIIIADVGLTEAFADYFTDENVDTLKAWAKLTVLLSWGGAFNQEFIDASNTFNQEFMGVSGSYTPEERAALTVQNTMPDYIGELYAERYFSEQAKQDVEKMVRDIIEVYRTRIQNLDWMSDTTKERALKKLDTMKIKIGYPDKFESAIDNAEILSAEEGGSYFTNMLAITAAQKAENIALQGQPVDKSQWLMYPFTVNACYSPQQNDITFPAAILQAPMYDVNASYEQNLGGIGYVIAHEITHAFDNNGAKFDENGNAADWWTEEDYAAFQQLCQEMIDFYDGEEGVPGIPMNGTLTLSENVADQGAAACITEIVAGLENPDFETLYKSMANSWAATASREYCQYAAQADVHSTEKLRVNRVVVNCDEFYETFDIQEGDGMWVAPEDRVRIW